MQARLCTVHLTNVHSKFGTLPIVYLTVHFVHVGFYSESSALFCVVCVYIEKGVFNTHSYT